MAFLFILTVFQLDAQDSTSVSKPGFFRKYWQSLINGNVDRTHEKPKSELIIKDSAEKRKPAPACEAGKAVAPACEAGKAVDCPGKS